jgi:hypothetical protein
MDEKIYSKEELYADDTLFNIELRLIVPEFDVVVTAYQKSLCVDVLKRFRKAIESNHFDYCKWHTK